MGKHQLFFQAQRLQMEDGGGHRHSQCDGLALLVWCALSRPLPCLLHVHGFLILGRIGAAAQTCSSTSSFDCCPVKFRHQCFQEYLGIRGRWVEICHKQLELGRIGREKKKR